MSSGHAFLALWNDLAGGREAEYDAWHTREHVPERVAAPGFRSGRRYVAPAHPVHRWFTLYDLADLGCLETPEYRDLLDNPTPASAAMRPHFRSFLRVPCVRLGAAGSGLAGALAVLRLPDEAALPDLAALAQEPGMVAAQFGRRADEGSAAGRIHIGAPETSASDAFSAVLLLEALDRAAAERIFATAAARYLPSATPALAAGGVYDLAFVFPASDPSEREAHRRSHWPAP
ncbi:hypothetical protein [Falsiroseomonas bella]|uniref:hypothetical protein n=1 Tax=Falsiroseomonas bella TaxID=2184016 RepID=UPI001304BCC8|nr:hypothetical protein [Falsiroseomonas bella]